MAFEIVGERFPEAETMASLLQTPVELSINVRPRKHDVPARAVLATLEFLIWMESRRRPIGPKDVVDRFGVSRATSYRWLRTYADARRLVWPPEDNQPVSFPARTTVPAYAGGALQ
jgi:hypothetical protein